MKKTTKSQQRRVKASVKVPVKNLSEVLAENVELLDAVEEMQDLFEQMMAMNEDLFKINKDLQAKLDIHHSAPWYKRWFK